MHIILVIQVFTFSCFGAYILGFLSNLKLLFTVYMNYCRFCMIMFQIFTSRWKMFSVGFIYQHTACVGCEDLE